MKYNHTIRMPGAFTLIELLIVVAIIAILAAIAVPNFLEAQTRAKVARVKADFRTITTGLESYRIDQNQFPRNNLYSWALSFGLNETQLRPTLERLTTPIAYLSGGSSFMDPFRGKKQVNGPQLGQIQDIPTPPEGIGKADRVYRYIARGPQNTVIWDQVNETQKVTWFLLESCGPYGYYHRMGDALNVADSAARRAKLMDLTIYDASNGTVSMGSIWRGTKGGKGDFFVDLIPN